jgi:hypothetical protein
MPHPEIFRGIRGIEVACAASHDAELDEKRAVGSRRSPWTGQLAGDLTIAVTVGR